MTYEQLIEAIDQLPPDKLADLKAHLLVHADLPTSLTQAELAEKMGLVSGAVYEISPVYDSFEAAAVLQGMIEQRKSYPLPTSPC